MHGYYCKQKTGSEQPHLEELRQDIGSASCIVSNMSIFPNQPHLFSLGGSHDHHHQLHHAMLMEIRVAYQVGVTILPARFQGPQVDEELHNLL